MNLRTSTEVDRAIAAACHLHDLRAGQTGTAPARRAINPERPADKAPVEFAAEDDDRAPSISDAIDRLDELHALLEAMHMMASALEMEQANALQRVVVLGQGMIAGIKEGLRPDAL